MAQIAPKAKVVSSVVMLTAARGVGVLLSLLASILLAGSLGASASTDAFFLVRRVTLGTVEGFGQVIRGVYIPPLVFSMRSEGWDATRKLFSSHLGRLLVISTVLCVLAAAGAPWLIAIIAPGFDSETARLASKLLRVMAFLLPAGLTLALLTSLLNADRSFGLPALVNQLPRLPVVIILLLFVPPLGVVSLTWALVLGTVAACLLLINPLRRLAERQSGSRSQTKAHPTNIRGRVLPLILVNGYAQCAIWVDFYFASRLQIGSVSVLEYGNRLMMLLPGILSSSVVSVMYTEFAHTAVTDGSGVLRRQFVNMQRVGLFLLVPLVTLLWTGATPIVELLLGHGRFGPAEVEATAAVMRYTGPAVIFSFLVSAMISELYVDEGAPRLRIFATMALLGLTARVILDAVLGARLGLPGLALAFSLTTGGVLAVMYAFLFRHWGRFLQRQDLRVVLAIAGAALAQCAAMRAVWEVWGSDPSESALLDLLRVAVAAILGIIAYLAAARLLRVDELSSLGSLLRRFRRTNRHHGDS